MPNPVRGSRTFGLAQDDAGVFWDPRNPALRPEPVRDGRAGITRAIQEREEILFFARFVTREIVAPFRAVEAHDVPCTFLRPDAD